MNIQIVLFPLLFLMSKYAHGEFLDGVEVTLERHCDETVYLNCDDRVGTLKFYAVPSEDCIVSVTFRSSCSSDSAVYLNLRKSFLPAEASIQIFENYSSPIESGTLVKQISGGKLSSASGNVTSITQLLTSYAPQPAFTINLQTDDEEDESNEVFFDFAIFRKAASAEETYCPTLGGYFPKEGACNRHGQLNTNRLICPSTYSPTTSDNPATASANIFKCETLIPSMVLLPEEAVNSTNGLIYLHLTTGGNLILNRRSDNYTIWRSIRPMLIVPNSSKECLLQADGNLVVYDKNNNRQWASNTLGNPGAVLTVDDTESMRIHKDDLTFWGFWSHGATLENMPNDSVSLESGSKFLPEDTLYFGNRMVNQYHTDGNGSTLENGSRPVVGRLHSKNKAVYLTMQSDGNLVLYRNTNVFNDSVDHPIWSTNTFRWKEPVLECVMQKNGDLVLYDQKHKIMWSSQTGGHPGAKLSMDDDGSIYIHKDEVCFWGFWPHGMKFGNHVTGIDLSDSNSIVNTIK
jgi:hypothetical protein